MWTVVDGMWSRTTALAFIRNEDKCGVHLAFEAPYWYVHYKVIGVLQWKIFLEYRSRIAIIKIHCRYLHSFCQNAGHMICLLQFAALFFYVWIFQKHFSGNESVWQRLSWSITGTVCCVYSFNVFWIGFTARLYVSIHINFYMKFFFRCCYIQPTITVSEWYLFLHHNLQNIKDEWNRIKWLN